MLEVMFDDGGRLRSVPLRGELTIGRSADNDVVLRDFSVSRRHARFVADDSGARIVDLDSTNGVKVNAAFVPEAEIHAGDILTIGSFTLQVRESDQATDGFTTGTFLRSIADINADLGLEGPPSGGVSRDLGERERLFEILAAVAKTLLEVDELRPVLEKVMDVVFAHLMVDRGVILLFDDAGEPKLELFRTRETRAQAEPEVPLSRTILNTVCNEKVAVLTHDAQADQRFEAGKSVQIHQIRAAMCAPLWHRDRVIGAIHVDSPLHVGSFSSTDLDLLTALANYAAVAIERAQLNERIRREELNRRRLERYHSPPVIETILSDSESPQAAAVSRETSILFADMVGFTSVSESLTPEEVAAFLERFFSLAVEAVFEFGGTLDKFVGDAVMAFFGAPLKQPDHAERAVRAAVTLLKALAGWNHERVRDGLEPVRVRVGINSGPAVVGDIGAEGRVDYTVLGNTVNVAARLQEHVAEPGEIVIGASTQQAVAELVPTQSLGEVALKGLSRKVPVYRVALEEITSADEEPPCD